MNKEKWLLADYYPSFSCKASKCRHNCCHGWRIALSKKEYEHFLSLQCDRDLRHRLDISFVEPDFVSEERYRIISFNYLGDCPLNKDGLCEVHRKLGEKDLPIICRLYPRSLKKINGKGLACCSTACEAVVETLLKEEDLSLIEKDCDLKAEINYKIKGDVLEELQHFEKLINGKGRLSDKIGKVCLEVNKEAFMKDFNADINPLKEALMVLERLRDNGFLGEIVDEVQARYRDNFFQYETDKNGFEENFPHWETYFKNVLNNSLLYENFPFVDDRFDQTNAYKGLCASYGLLRVLCIGYCASHPKREDLIDCIAALFHLIDHTSFYYNSNVLVTSAALLLKL